MYLIFLPFIGKKEAAWYFISRLLLKIKIRQMCFDFAVYFAF